MPPSPFATSSELGRSAEQHVCFSFEQSFPKSMATLDCQIFASQASSELLRGLQRNQDDGATAAGAQ